MEFETHYKIITFSVGDTKSGSKMGKLQVKNLETDALLNCILWEETLNRMDSKMFRNGNIIKITNGSYNEKYNNCLVNSFEVVKEGKLGLEKEDRENLFKGIIACVEEFKDGKLRDFTLKTLRDNEELFKISPAAKLMHHNYIGGLIKHIFECVEYMKVIYPLFVQKIDKDTVFSAVILHDIGKIFEYKIDTESGLIEYDEDFRKDWITHTQYAFSLCMQNGFKQVAKMIAAHHGRADWGAIVDLNTRDLEPYYYAVHHVDDLSAKFGKISINDLN